MHKVHVLGRKRKGKKNPHAVASARGCHLREWIHGGPHGRPGGGGEAALELPVVVLPPRSVVVSAVADDSNSSLLQLLYKLCCFVCHGLYITTVALSMMIIISSMMAPRMSTVILTDVRVNSNNRSATIELGR